MGVPYIRGAACIGGFMVVDNYQDDLTFYVATYLVDLILQGQQKMDHYAMVMTDFAVNMMNVLETINKDSFNQFQLRIGEQLYL